MRQFIVLVITPQRWRRRTKGTHGELWEKMPGEQTTRTPCVRLHASSVTAHRRRSVFHRSPLRLYMYTARDERNTDHKIILLSCDRIVRGTYEVDWQTCAILYSMQWRAMRQGFLTAWTAHPRPAEDIYHTLNSSSCIEFESAVVKKATLSLCSSPSIKRGGYR